MPRFDAVIIKNTVSGKLDEKLYAGEVVKASGDWLRGDVLPTAKRYTPKDTNALAQSLKVHVSERVAGISSNSRKAGFVHGKLMYPNPPVVGRRTRPHFPPPNQSLTAWSRRHGIPLFLAQRSVKERGTELVPFIDLALRDEYPKLAQHIDAAARRIEAKFNR